MTHPRRRGRGRSECADLGRVPAQNEGYFETSLADTIETSGQERHAQQAKPSPEPTPCTCGRVVVEHESVGERARPPSGNTGASVTSGDAEVGLHWLAGVSRLPVDTVLDVLHEVTGDSVEIMPRGRLGYATQYRMGDVVVLADGQGPQAEAMGVHVDLSGSVCDRLGLVGLVQLYGRLELEATRVDVAVDGCPFTVATVWDAWKADQVRTKVKLDPEATPDRPWRHGRRLESASGDTVYLGSPRAARMARIYDRRETGTRFELQIRHGAAAVVAADLLAGDFDGWPGRALGHVRAFVDFVDTSDSNSTRRELLPWWSAFIGHVERSRLRLCGVVVESMERVQTWVERQVAPTLALYRAVFGDGRLAAVLEGGVDRWRGRHRRLLASATGAAG